MSGSDSREQSLLELRVLQRVADDVTAALDLDEILARCLTTSSEVAQTSSCAIYLRDDRRKVFRRSIARDVLEHDAHLPTAEMDAAFAQRSSALVDLNDPTYAQHPAVKASREFGFLATLNLPMRWHGRLIGLLILAFRDRTTLPQSTVRTLEAIIGYQAAAVENARAHQLIERRARLALTLRQFSERTISITDVEALHRIILDTALALSGADRGLLSCVEGDQTIVVSGVGCCAGLVGQKVPLTDRWVAASIAQSDPLVVEVVSAMEPGSPVAAAAQRQATAQMIILTMRHDETPIGQVMVGTAAARDWGDEEIEALRTLASMAAELTERVRIQAARELEQRRLGESIEHLPIGIAVVDRTFKAVHINQAAQALAERLGIHRGNWRESMTRLRTIGGQPFGPQDSAFLRAFRGEHPPPHDVRYLPEGSDRALTLRGAAAPLLDVDGSVMAVVIGFQEVTELYDLADARERFVRIASHELRSPITSLRATTQLLALDPSAMTDPERRALLLARLDRQSVRLVNLVGQLLDVTRLHAEELPLQLGECDLVTLCRQVTETDRRVQIEASGAVVGRWDAVRIEQVLTNLVVNALHYSHADSPVIVRVGESDGRARLQVIDRGIGIPPAEMQRLFTPFHRTPAAASQHRAGLGLGLHITREIVRRHGGTIDVRSEPGTGSTFTVELPLRGP
jgi:signal transduction histidine kinase